MGDMVDEYVGEIDKLLKKHNFDEQDDSKIDKDEINMDLSDIKDNLDAIKKELPTLDPKRKAEIQRKMRQFQDKVDILKRKSLIGGGAQRSMADMTAEERGKQSTDTLRAARAQLNETQGVADDTLTRLQEQEGTIKKSQQRVDGMNKDLSYSNKLVTKMGKWWRG